MYFCFLEVNKLINQKVISVSQEYLVNGAVGLRKSIHVAFGL